MKLVKHTEKLISEGAEKTKFMEIKSSELRSLNPVMKIGRSKSKEKVLKR